MSSTFLLLPHFTQNPHVSAPNTTRTTETQREPERARLSTLIMSHQEGARRTHIRIHNTLISLLKAETVRLVLQAWGEETFAVLERLCRSGLFPLLHRVSVPSACLRPAFSSPSYHLTPPWHLQRRREGRGDWYLCVSVYRPHTHPLLRCLQLMLDWLYLPDECTPPESCIYQRGTLVSFARCCSFTVVAWEW